MYICEKETPTAKHTIKGVFVTDLLPAYNQRWVFFLIIKQLSTIKNKFPRLFLIERE